MAKSKKPRKPYRPPNYAQRASELPPSSRFKVPQTSDLPKPDSPGALQFAENMARTEQDAKQRRMKYAQAQMRRAQGKSPTPRKRTAAPRKTTVRRQSPAPAITATAGPSRASRVRGRYLVAGAAGAGVIGGAAYLAHRRRTAVHKGLIDPLTGEGVVFEKSYLEDFVDSEPRGALVSKATGMAHLTRTSVSTGRGRTWERPGTSHENRLSHTRHRAKQNPRGKLLHIKKSLGPQSYGQALAMSGTPGRRIVSAY